MRRHRPGAWREVDGVAVGRPGRSPLRPAGGSGRAELIGSGRFLLPDGRSRRGCGGLRRRRRDDRCSRRHRHARSGDRRGGSRGWRWCGRGRTRELDPGAVLVARRDAGHRRKLLGGNRANRGGRAGRSGARPLGQLALVLLAERLVGLPLGLALLFRGESFDLGKIQPGAGAVLGTEGGPFGHAAVQGFLLARAHPVEVVRQGDPLALLRRMQGVPVRCQRGERFLLVGGEFGPERSRTGRCLARRGGRAGRGARRRLGRGWLRSRLGQAKARQAQQEEAAKQGPGRTASGGADAVSAQRSLHS